MRVIGGKYKGLQLQLPKNFNQRPTTDFAKEALFQIIESEYDLKQIRALDLFGGSGAIAIELYSRGCKDVCTIEFSSISLKTIIDNVNRLQLPIKIQRADVFKVLKKKALNPFDLIFADPPYKSPNIKDIPHLVFDNEHLKENGLLIVEHDKNTDLSSCINFTTMRKYGNVQFSFFKS